MSFRDTKRVARRRLHSKMQVPAVFMTSAIDLVGTPVTVRLHTKWDALGDQKGTSFNSAEMESMIPKIVLMRDQIPSPLTRGNIVSVEPGEAYFIDHAEEPDDITITVHVKLIDAADATDFPVPENG